MSASPPEVPLWVLFFFGGLALVGALSHWRFRTGWQMTSGRLSPPPAAFEVMMKLHYAALPEALGGASAFFGLLLFVVAEPGESDAVRLVILAMFTLCAGCVVWLVKEVNRPTKARTPDWLQREGRRRGVPWL